MTRIKICGIRTVEDAQAAVDAGADALGLNFWKPGKRYVDPDRAAEIAASVPPFVSLVGVFVDECAESVRSIVQQVGLHAVQPHDLLESKELGCGGGRPGYGAQVIPVIRPRTEEDLAEGIRRLDALGIAPTAFLLDTPSETLPGGTGKRFDWNLAVHAKRYGRVILSGGLNPENVAEGIRKVRPYAVDGASGVENAPAVKDGDKMRAFVRAVREADSDPQAENNL